MKIFNLRKQLKRRWKRWRRAIWTITACGLVAVMAWVGIPLSDQMERLMEKDSLAVETLGMIKELTFGEFKEAPTEASTLTAPSNEWLSDIQKSNQAYIVHLNKIYSCGEEKSILGIMRPDEIASLMNQHPDYTGRIGPDGEVWLDEHIYGMSEVCQRDGYIGIDKNSNLSLFEGPPKDEKVIKTFFQLDVGTMESSLPRDVLNQLREGIRVQDIEEYNSVLSTFSDFAVELSEKAMQQTNE